MTILLAPEVLEADADAAEADPVALRDELAPWLVDAAAADEEAAETLDETDERADEALLETLEAADEATDEAEPDLQEEGKIIGEFTIIRDIYSFIASEFRRKH
ncbi:hypothetical protein JCM10908_005612 [Rhodotorula pacifica]|uniref:uncharacterized protein n=1 Tax=Rhodotorula pacifica TaxID=1495444 RepID=UPI00317A3A1F